MTAGQEDELAEIEKILETFASRYKSEDRAWREAAIKLHSWADKRIAGILKPSNSGELGDKRINEKTPTGASSYSLTLNTLDYITDTLKGHALAVVANAHSEMTDEQFHDLINELTPAYANAIKSLFDKRIKLPEKRDVMENPEHLDLQLIALRQGFNAAVDEVKRLNGLED